MTTTIAMSISGTWWELPEFQEPELYKRHAVKAQKLIDASQRRGNIR